MVKGNGEGGPYRGMGKGKVVSVHFASWADVADGL